MNIRAGSPSRSRSLRWRLTAVSLASMGVALLAVAIGIVGHGYAENRRAAMADLRIQASMIARSATAALEFGDPAAAGEILGALEVSESVLAAELREPGGRVLARRSWERGGPATGSDLVEVREPVVVDGRQAGSAHLTVDLGGLRQRNLEYLGVVILAAMAASVIGYFMLKWLVHRLLLPLDRLATVARRVTQTSDFGLRAPEETHDEIGVLARGFNDMLAQIQVRDSALADELSQRRTAEGRLAQLAHFDPVTHLPNRHYFNERIEHVLHDSHILGARTALLLIDIDDFKLVNDTLGHHVGDGLLEEMGRCIKAQVRANDTVARIGGDEFAVILEHVRGRDEPRQVVEKIVKALSGPLEAGGHAVHVGVSVGIALFPADAQTVTGFLQRADTALYDAKARGKRGYRFFEPEMDRRIQHRIKLEAELRLARAREEFFLEYQPQVNLANGSHAGVEALVRWRHPERGVVSPGDFIPIAEESGLIGEIGQFVLDASLAQARVWQEQGVGMGQLAINVSTRQFESEDFVAAVLEALKRHGIAPGVLELEITESLLMGGAEAIERITALHRAGVRFAIDDFGTGYSSLSYLKRVPISTLKIDRHFIADLGRGAEDRAITQAIIALGQSLEITTVAEGIDTGAGLDLLRRMGCTLGQGFVIAHPLPAASVPGFIRSWTQGRQRANGMPADPGAQGRLPDL